MSDIKSGEKRQTIKWRKTAGHHRMIGQAFVSECGRFTLTQAPAGTFWELMDGGEYVGPGNRFALARKAASLAGL